MGREFRIVLDLANDGAFDITNGEVYLTNVIGQDLSISGSEFQSINLHGRSQDYPAGEKKLYSWVARANTVPETLTTRMGFAAEYSYRTDADIPVCIDPDVYNEVQGKKPCVMQEHIALTGQGAPVAVTSVDILRSFDATESSGLVDFKITVSNVGNGEISVGSLSSSQPDYLTAQVTISGQPVNCDESKISIENGKGEVICHIRYNLKDATVGLLHVRLDYIYRQKIEPREIRIKKKL